MTGLTGLEQLSIDGTTVSDAGLRHLEELTRLKILMAYDAQVTAAGKSQLLKALPNLTIWISSPHGTKAAARAEKPPVGGGNGSVPSNGRIFTQDGNLIYVNIYSTDPNADQKDLVNFANATVIPRLRRIKGMDVPRNLANRYSALRVRLNPDQMGASDLSPKDIRKALTPSGMIDPNVRRDEVMDKTLESKEYGLIHIGRFNKPEQYENIVLKASPDGEILRLKDIGRVELSFPFFDISSDIDGHPAATIVLKSLPGGSAAVATKAVEKDLEELKAAFPPGMNLEVIPLDSRDMIYAVIEAPRDSTLEYEYTRAKCHELGAIARGIDGITSVSSLAGYQIRTEDHGLGAGTSLIHLKNRSDRKLTSRQIIETVEEKCRTMNVDLEFFEPPAVSVFVASGSCSVRVLDKTNSYSDRRPGSGAETFMDDLLKRKNLEGLFTFLAGHYPRYELVINNDVARQKGVSIADAMENLLVIMGGDVQAEGTFERVAEDFSNRFVKNGRGEMVPYSSFLQLKLKHGLNEIDR